MKARPDFSHPSGSSSPSYLCMPAGRRCALNAAHPQHHNHSHLLRCELTLEHNVCQPLSPAPSLVSRFWETCSKLQGQPPALRSATQPRCAERAPAAELQIPLPRAGKDADGALSPRSHTRLSSPALPAPAGTAPCSPAIPAPCCHQHICNT